MRTIHLFSSLFALGLAACGGSGGGEPAPPGAAAGAFLHEVTAGSRPINSRTVLDHALVNDKPGAIVHVSSNADVGSSVATFAPMVTYDPVGGDWQIVNASGSVDVGVAFNVLVRTPGPNDFVHTASPPNVIDRSTYLQHPLLDGDPHAVLLVTQRVSPDVGRVGVWYDDSRGSWAIYREDGSPAMPPDSAFHVSIFEADPGAQLHMVSSRTAPSGYSELAHPWIDGNPDALIFFTHVWNPLGAPLGPYADLPFATQFGVPGTLLGDPSFGRWILSVMVPAPMPVGAGFNVVVR